jgi:hypothetical protein
VKLAWARPRPEPPLAKSPACAPDADWKQKARADLNELVTRAAPFEALTRWAASENEAISLAIAGAVEPTQCGAVEQRLQAFHRRVQAAEQR